MLSIYNHCESYLNTNEVRVCLFCSASAVGGEMPQYNVAKPFADRRYKVQSARTYFYLNEATCERNYETFQDCLHAVAGKLTYSSCII